MARRLYYRGDDPSESLAFRIKCNTLLLSFEFKSHFTSHPLKVMTEYKLNLFAQEINSIKNTNLWSGLKYTCPRLYLK